MTDYLVIPLKSNPDDFPAVYDEVQLVLAAMKAMQAESTHAEVLEKYGAEVAHWVFSTNMNTVKLHFANAEDGSLILGLSGEPLF